MKPDMNILLVEDNDLEVEILKRGLKKIGAGNALICARDGLEALELLNEDLVHPTLPHPFVIMLDINMPRMNGHEFLAALRASDDFRHLRVFMFTTSDSVRDIELAYQKNASGFIVKPSSASELINVLNSLRQFWAICADPPPGGRDGTDQMAGTC